MAEEWPSSAHLMCLNVLSKRKNIFLCIGRNVSEEETEATIGECGDGDHHHCDHSSRPRVRGQPARLVELRRKLCE